ncbi:MAG: hypothetical protein ACYTGC_19500 [Planctomycetota bacterium]
MPADLAFMAMAHERLGHEQEAREHLRQLREAMRDPEVADSRDNRTHLAEAETFFSAAESAGGRLADR